jgi:hypothetical protein
MRITDTGLYPGTVEERIDEAKLHPRMVGFGFTHWSRIGWNIVTHEAVSVLTFDSDCPRCMELKEKHGKGDWTGRPEQCAGTCPINPGAQAFDNFNLKELKKEK